ncbi:hypothetical protein [Streptomyces iranensis]|uniref:Alkanesulfonate monooxygenase n=1 Tax=Streptomyces iranensis TaxID=576784 RepID=A0A060ZHB1_9ACTN|nr:hypothetical protein [Streptomyces iranensis]MBP2061332.1 hypothetical protein [Streptomyces iranensis]CDR05383.1 alkanesulfonate monooxygenase [Streptomyces iranensis]
MPVEFSGMISTMDHSEIRLDGGPVIDKDLTGKFARAHGDTGFDRVPMDQFTGGRIAAHIHYSGVESAQQPRVRPHFGGLSEAAHRVGGKHADTYAPWGEPLAESAGAAA